MISRRALQESGFRVGGLVLLLTAVLLLPLPVLIAAWPRSWVAVLVLPVVGILLLRPPPACGDDAYADGPGPQRGVPRRITWSLVLAVGACLLGSWLLPGAGAFLLWCACILAAAALMLQDSKLRPNVASALLLLVWIHPLPPPIRTWLRQILQQLSARGAEWGLHLFHIRVWRDGTILRTDLQSFPIPLMSHGEDVAVLAFLLALALAAWNRFRPVETLLQAVLALGAFAIANALRILVVLAIMPQIGPNVLRASAGPFAFGMALVIMAITAFLLHDRHARQRKRQRLRGAVTGALSEFPPFWHRVFRRHRSAWIFLPLLALLGGLLFLNRPSQRRMLLRDVAEDLREQGKHDLALRLARQIAIQEPDDPDWTLTTARMFLLAGRPQEAAQWLDTHPPSLADHAADIALLRAYIAIASQDTSRASKAIQTLPAHSQPHPDWAILLAELAFARHDAETLRTIVPLAAQNPLHARRLLPMLPLLYKTASWPALLAATANLAPTERTQNDTYLRIHALLQMGDFSAAAALTTLALQQWPNDMRILRPLTLLTYSNPSAWSPRFHATMIRLIDSHAAPHTLFALLESAYTVSRPDLAWACFRKLQRTAPEHPYTALAWAIYFPDWFRFRRQHLGFPGDTEQARIDLYPLFALVRHLPRGQRLTNRIPGLDTIAAAKQPRKQQQQSTRQQALAACNSFPATRQDDALMQHEARLLLLEGRLPEADHLLEKRLALHPDSPEALLAASDLLRRQGRLRQAYQQLLPRFLPPGVLTLESPDAHSWPPQPIALPPHRTHQLPLLLRLLAYQLALDRPLSAAVCADEVLRRFPADPVARTAAAAVHLHQGRAGQALDILQDTRHRRLPITDELESIALLATHRHNEVAVFRRQQLLPPQSTPDFAQPMPERLAPAERLLTPPPPDAASVPADTPAYTTQSWLALAHAIVTQPTNRHSACPPHWAWPSNRLAQAELLHRITHILVAHQDLTAAAQVAKLAVSANPHVPALWLELLGLSAEKADILAAARQFCPQAPDLWLADLVWQAREQQHDNVDARIAEAIAAPDMPVDTLVQAADFLWRGNHLPEAMTLIEHWQGRERHLLPALLLGVEAATYRNRPAETLVQIQRAIAASAEVATDLYARYLHTKVMMGSLETNQDFIQAIQAVRRTQPGVAFWSELLGYVRFQRGGTDLMEAGQAMDAALSAGSTNRIAFVISAESARRANRKQDAIDTLRAGLAIHPEDPVLLNNLAYTLAQSPNTITEAANLIPQLIPPAEENAEIRDTLALVLLRSGSQDLARDLLSRNLRETSPDSPVWFKGQMRLAEILWRQGRTQTAISMLEQLLRGARSIPDTDLLDANRLLTRIASTPPTDTPEGDSPPAPPFP